MVGGFPDHAKPPLTNRPGLRDGLPGRSDRREHMAGFAPLETTRLAPEGDEPQFTPAPENTEPGHGRPRAVPEPVSRVSGRRRHGEVGMVMGREALRAKAEHGGLLLGLG